MKYYKNHLGQVFGFEDDQLHLVTNDMVEITDDEFHEFRNPTPTTEQILATARAKALADYESAIEAMIGKVPNTELSSWPKQESEARNLDKPTPMLDQLIISRGQGEAREQLAAKIIANADAYAVGYAKVLGEYQAKLKLLV